MLTVSSKSAFINRYITFQSLAIITLKFVVLQISSMIKCVIIWNWPLDIITSCALNKIRLIFWHWWRGKKKLLTSKQMALFQISQSKFDSPKQNATAAKHSSHQFVHYSWLETRQRLIEFIAAVSKVKWNYHWWASLDFFM